MKKIIMFLILVILLLSTASFATTYDESEIESIAETKGDRSTVFFKDMKSMGLTDGNGKLIPLVRAYSTIVWQDEIYDHFVVEINTGKIDSQGISIFKVGVIDKNGKEIFEPVYDRAMIVRNNRVVLRNNTSGLEGVYSYDGTPIIPMEAGYNEILRLNGWAVIEKPKPYYYNIDYNLFTVQKGNKFGILDNNGKKVTEIDYDMIDSHVIDAIGLLRVNKNGLYGYINKQGKVVIPLVYKNIYYDNGYLVAQNDKVKFALLTTANKVLLPFEYDRIFISSDKKIYVDQNEKRYEFNPKTNTKTFVKNLEYDPLVYASYPSSWAEKSIKELKNTGQFKSESFNAYQKNITRKDFIYLAVRIYELFDGKEIIPDPSIRFNDTSDIYALKGATIGITTGVGNGNFGPNQELTREQLAVMMINTLQLGNLHLSENANYSFEDENKFSAWAKEKIYLAKANGIISGTGKDLFNAQGQATIEQALVITNQILKNNMGKEWKANGDGHTIELPVSSVVYADKKIEDLQWGKVNVAENQVLIDALSKYGKVDALAQDAKIIPNSIGITYYYDGNRQRSSSDMSIYFPSEGVLKITLNSYDETIKAIIKDFMYISFGEAYIKDTLNRIFADIESTKIIKNSGNIWYTTQDLSGKTVILEKTKIEYNEESFFEIKVFY